MILNHCAARDQFSHMGRPALMRVVMSKCYHHLFDHPIIIAGHTHCAAAAM